MSKRLFLFITILLFPVIVWAAKPTSTEILREFARNTHGGMEVNTVDGKTSYSGYVGTGYRFFFYKNKAYVKPEIDVKWGQYRYESDYKVETTSIAVPVTVGYNLFQEEFLGMNLFGGVRYEQILHSSNNNYNSGINNSQVGLTAGTSIRLLNTISFNISYYYGLTSLFKDGTGKVSSFNFSFNF